MRTPTAYNTYTIDGLPLTPIALPSRKAIEAIYAFNHAKTFISVATGNGGHKFYSFIGEHNQAVQEYLNVLRRSEGVMNVY